MNNVYLYNGEFASLLNLITFLLKNHYRPVNIKKEGYNNSLFENPVTLKLKENNKIIDYYINKMGFFNFKLIFYVYLSNNNNKEIIIYYYILNFFKYGNKVYERRNLKCVNEVLKINRQVGNEAHRFKGFVRFKELKNKVLYAKIAPDNDILEIVAQHFKKRLKNEIWIIQDEVRNTMCIYDKNEIYFFKNVIFDFNKFKLSNDEDEFEQLWQTFYKTIEIKERHNERCRLNFMPKKYWQNILEVSDIE